MPDVLPAADIAGIAAPAGAELESLAQTLQASLAVRTRADLVNCAVAPLRRLIGHQALLCALCAGESSLHLEVFSPRAENARGLGEVQGEEDFMPCVVRAWIANRFEPLLLDTAITRPFASSAMSRELRRIDATTLLVHGTHDVRGHAESVFAFACSPGVAGQRELYLAQIVVPLLYTAWVRTQMQWNPQEHRPHAPEVVLTPREQEILHWASRGKTNPDIGAILSISPFTVKNHMQKILRKLQVQNRTQAVGKAAGLGMFQR
jgi:transcriptional regulator EpsA